MCAPTSCWLLWNCPTSVLLALFGPLLTNVPGLGEGNVWDWFVPGVLAMIAIFGTSMTGSNLLVELHDASHERMLVTPLGYVVSAERALFAGDFADTTVLHGVLATVSVAVVGVGVGIRAMRRQ